MFHSFFPIFHYLKRRLVLDKSKQKSSCYYSQFMFPILSCPFFVPYLLLTFISGSSCLIKSSEQVHRHCVAANHKKGLFPSQKHLIQIQISIDISFVYRSSSYFILLISINLTLFLIMF